jgi:rRNA maturation endonuclease Nob1
MSFKCALCGEQHSHNVYYCSQHSWHLCWDCVRKAALTNKLTCPKCGHEVHRVD